MLCLHPTEEIKLYTSMFVWSEYMSFILSSSCFVCHFIARRELKQFSSLNDMLGVIMSGSKCLSFLYVGPIAIVYVLIH